ncbi:unnamed protein product [Arabidopsis halleri]
MQDLMARNFRSRSRRKPLRFWELWMGLYATKGQQLKTCIGKLPQGMLANIKCMVEVLLKLLEGMDNIFKAKIQVGDVYSQTWFVKPKETYETFEKHERSRNVRRKYMQLALT